MHRGVIRSGGGLQRWWAGLLLATVRCSSLESDVRAPESSTVTDQAGQTVREGGPGQDAGEDAGQAVQAQEPNASVSDAVKPPANSEDAGLAADSDFPGEVPSAEDACATFDACGGDLVGGWQVVGVCLEGYNDMFLDVFPEPECAGAYRGLTVAPAGLITFDAGGRTISSIRLPFQSRFVFDAACIQAQIPGAVAESFCPDLESELQVDPTATDVVCEVIDDACSCEFGAEAGFYESTSTYRVEGHELVFEDEGETSVFCVQGDVLRIFDLATGMTMLLTRAT